MVRNVIVAMGYTGYRHQLDRARRFLERMEAVDANEVEFQDMVWAFFQNCWHVKDWVEHDPQVPRLMKDAVIDRAHRSSVLKICREMCNGTKHLGAQPGAEASTHRDEHRLQRPPGNGPRHRQRPGKAGLREDARAPMRIRMGEHPPIAGVGYGAIELGGAACSFKLKTG